MPRALANCCTCGQFLNSPSVLLVFVCVLKFYRLMSDTDAGYFATCQPDPAIVSLPGKPEARMDDCDHIYVSAAGLRSSLLACKGWQPLSSSSSMMGYQECPAYARRKAWHDSNAANSRARRSTSPVVPVVRKDMGSVSPSRSTKCLSNSQASYVPTMGDISNQFLSPVCRHTMYVPSQQFLPQNSSGAENIA